MHHELPAHTLSSRVELTQMDGSSFGVELEQGSDLRDLRIEIEMQCGQPPIDQYIYTADGLLMDERGILEDKKFTLVINPTHRILQQLHRGEIDNLRAEELNEMQARNVARYLVEKQDPKLWAEVLVDEERKDQPFRRALIDQVVRTSLRESKSADEVSTTIKAFMSANMPLELIELLECLILVPTQPASDSFSNNRQLQNLLILTAMKADKDRVMGYVNRLHNFDGPEIARLAVAEPYELFEEAFAIYEKFGLNVQAVGVILERIQSRDRACEFAKKCNDPLIWAQLPPGHRTAGQ
jgi:hypothetical protein